MSGYQPPIGFNVPDPSYPSQGGPGYPPQGAPGYPPQGAPGYPPQGGPTGYPPQGGPQNPMFGGAAPLPGPGYGAQPGYGAPQPQQAGSGYGAPPPQHQGYGAPGGMGGSSYGDPQPGYGAPPSGQPGAGYGAPPPGQPGPGYGAPAPGYGAPSPYGAPPQPAAGYGGANAPPYGGAGGYGGGATGGYGASAQPMGPGGVMGGANGRYYTGRPTVFPAQNFDPGKDADVLRKAMRGLGTDEATIIDVLSKRTAAQRQQIASRYKASFGKSLEKDLKSELSGKFEDVVLLSLMDLPRMLAESLYNAMDGAGTKEWALIQVLVPFSNAIIKQTVQAFSELLSAKGKSSKRNLESYIRGDTSGDFEKILVALMQGCRDEQSPANPSQAQADAEELYRAGEKRMGTEEAVFTRILSQRSFDQIKAISTAYQQKYGRTLIKAIEKETSGYYEKTLVSIVKFAESKNGLLAEWFYDSMAGLGTRDEMLIRLVLSRCEIDLGDVKEAYMRQRNKTLARAIEGDTSGDYRRMLIALVGQ